MDAVISQITDEMEQHHYKFKNGADYTSGGSAGCRWELVRQE